MLLRRRYVKAVVLSPYIGSLLLCAAGVVAGGLVLARLAKSVPAPMRVSVAGRVTSASVVTPVAQTVPAAVLKAAVMESARPRVSAGLFAHPLDAEMRADVLAERGVMAHDAMQQPKMWNVLERVSPNALFHLGLDMPLTEALRAVLGRSAMPVKVIDGRYVLMTKVTESGADLPEQGRGKGFLWVDLQTGVALGGIYFAPSNGEPTPTLTIFSNQVHTEQVKMSELPEAFRRDVHLWEQLSLTPPLETRYFISASGRKTVLTHDEELCDEAMSAAACAKRKADAVEIDQRAQNYLGQVHYASNATAWMIPTAGSGSE